MAALRGHFITDFQHKLVFSSPLLLLLSICRPTFPVVLLSVQSFPSVVLSLFSLVCLPLLFREISSSHVQLRSSNSAGAPSVAENEKGG